MNKDEAKSVLEQRGYSNVKLQPVLTGDDQKDKVVLATPNIGTNSYFNSVTQQRTVLQSGEDDNVSMYWGYRNPVLYYGTGKTTLIEAMRDEGNMDELPVPQDPQYSDPNEIVMENLNKHVFVGRWCNRAHECVTLREAPHADGGLMSDTLAEQYKKRKGYRMTDTLQVFPFIQASTTLDMAKQSRPQMLITGDTNFAELFVPEDLYCGDRPSAFMGSMPPGCVNGIESQQINDSGSQDDTGYTYTMSELYVIGAAGADLQSLYDHGYFRDKPKGEMPDMSQPVLFKRDPKLYEKSTKPYSDGADPFSPLSSQKDRVKFAPAADTSTAYYRDDNPLDQYEPNMIQVSNAQGQLDEKRVESALDVLLGKQTLVDQASGQSVKAESMSVSQLQSALNSGDYSALAGLYCRKSNDCISLDTKGKAAYFQYGLSNNGSTQMTVNKYNRALQDGTFGGFSSDADETVCLASKEVGYGMASIGCQNAQKRADAIGVFSIGNFFNQPADFMFVPHGGNVQDYLDSGLSDKTVSPPDSDKSYITWVGSYYPGVKDDLAYYLVKADSSGK